MILTSDINLHNPLWDEAERKLKDDMKLFSRLVDIFLIACSIGIKDDEIIADEEGLSIVRTIGRNTYQSMINTDLKEQLDYMLQNAIINSKHLSFDMDERLKLAFDPDYKNDKLKPASFLAGFANYGISQILNTVKSDSPIVAIGELFAYLTTLSDSVYDELLQNITLDKID